VKAWLSRMLSEGDGSPSMKRFMFVGACSSAIFFCAADFVMHGGLSSNMLQLFNTVIVTTGGAYSVGRIAEATENNKI
jgi:hypothetical protein